MNKIKNALIAAKQVSARSSARLAAVTTGLLVGAGNVMAQTTPDDPGLAAITALKSSATAYIAAGFAVLTIVVAGYWGMGMYRKISGKAK